MSAKFATAALAPSLLLLSGCIIQIKGSGSWEGRGNGWHALSDGSDRPLRMGSGVAGTETREVAPFSELSIAGDLSVEIAAGAEEPSLTVTGDDNLLQFVHVRQRGRRLRVELEPARYAFEQGVAVRIGVPELSDCRLEGREEVSIEGLSGESFVLVVDDTAAVRGSGAVGSVEVEVNGTSTVDLSGLEAHAAAVQINGTATVTVNASAELRAEINGTGSVLYRGQPATTSIEINGTGHVSRAE